MRKVLDYIKNRNKAREDYYHLKGMPDRLLQDIGLDRKGVEEVLKKTKK